MSDEPILTEQDILNHAKGQDMPAPEHLLEIIMDRVKELELEQELERESEDLSPEELDAYYGRKRAEREQERER